MEFTIKSRQMDVPDRLRTAAVEKLSRLTRHLDGWDHAEVHFLEERNPRISAPEVCEVTLRGHGQILRAKAASDDPFTAVDRVVDKLAHQVEKLKSCQSRKGHHRSHPVDSAAGEEPERDGDGEAAGVRIVKVKQFDLKPMTPEEAALNMEMLAHTFYFFTNAETGMAALVYRRNDGDVGLIDAG